MRISVVLTAYNATWCIERALDSVMAQTHPAAEVIVCDDGSTDGTPDRVEQRYGACVQVLRLPHRNASATRAVGLGWAGGDWLAFLDADDIWVADKLERQCAFLRRHPDVRWLCSDGVFASAEGVIRESWLADYFDPVREVVGDLMPVLIERCFPLVSSVLVERGAYHAAGGLDPGIVYSHDYDLWLRVLSRHRGAVMAERLITYWSSPGALSGRYEERYRDNLALMRRVERGEIVVSRAVRERAARRATALEFDLAVAALRAGRLDDARDRLRRATRHGPLRRRLLASAGAHAPGWVFRLLRRSGSLRRLVAGAREPVAPRCDPRKATEDSAA